MTVQELMNGLVKHDKGVLSPGRHYPESRQYCALEFRSVMKNREFSDLPVDIPDIRSLNDAFPNNASRTKHLIPVMAAIWDWDKWSNGKRQKFAEHLIISTVNDVISALPGLPAEIVESCRSAQSISVAADAAAATARAADAASAAAWAAAWAAADAAADAARAAARAAHAAADAVRAADAARAARIAVQVLSTACNCWLKAADQVKEMS